MDFIFDLEKYSGAKSRFFCPKCNYKGEFTRYINTQTKGYIAADVGICNRIEKCGYHLSPKEYFKMHNLGFEKLNGFVQNEQLERYELNERNERNEQSKHFDTISHDVVSKTLDLNIALNSNNFVKYLLKKFSDSLTIELIEKFKIGTAKNNFTVFYQFDTDGHVRTGKKILYDPNTGKRKAEIQFIHKNFNLNYKLEQSFFGLHQLQNNYEKVAIFESEKTAILMSAYLRDFICLASGGANSLQLEKFKILKEKKCKSIILFPDKSCFERWSYEAKKISKILNIEINVSKVLEKSDFTNNGEDLADYLNFDENYKWALSSDGYPVFWDFP